MPFWGLGEPFSPTAEALRRAPAEWLIVDAAEWRWHHAEHSAGGGEALERALDECCERVHVTPAATVYRVKTAGRSARAFGELP